MPHSAYGGRHELGQNFLTHKPTIDRIISLVGKTHGPILEMGAGDGALTRRIAGLGRPFTAIDLDEHRLGRLQQSLPRVKMIHGDALQYPLRARVVVGNIPFHLTTPILRRLLTQGTWTYAILLTQWEVARRRAGVGGSTMMTAQSAPWFEFTLHGRVPSWGFDPQPSVDGGLLSIRRRGSPLVPLHQRKTYERFVRSIFTGRGRGLGNILAGSNGLTHHRARRALDAAGVSPRALPRDLTASQWAALWEKVRG